MIDFDAAILRLENQIQFKLRVKDNAIPENTGVRGENQGDLFSSVAIY